MVSGMGCRDGGWEWGKEKAGLRTVREMKTRLTCVDGVDKGKDDEHGAELVRLVDAVQAERHGAHDGEAVLESVPQVGKDVARVAVAAEALQKTPDARPRCKKAEQARV